MLEKTLEKRCKKYLHTSGGWLVKLGWIRGMPDRMALLPGGVVCFIEFKRPGEKPKPLQYHRLSQLRRLGFLAEWTDSYEGFREIINKALH